jgi:hypothetical protein
MESECRIYRLPRFTFTNGGYCIVTSQTESDGRGATFEIYYVGKVPFVEPFTYKFDLKEYPLDDAFRPDHLFMDAVKLAQDNFHFNLSTKFAEKYAQDLSVKRSFDLQETNFDELLVSAHMDNMHSELASIKQDTKCSKLRDQINVIGLIHPVKNVGLQN